MSRKMGFVLIFHVVALTLDAVLCANETGWRTISSELVGHFFFLMS